MFLGVFSLGRLVVPSLQIGSNLLTYEKLHCKVAIAVQRLLRFFAQTDRHTYTHTFTNRHYLIIDYFKTEKI